MLSWSESTEDAFDSIFIQKCPADDELGQLVEYLIELDVVFVSGEHFAAAEATPEFAFAAQELVDVSQEELQLRNVAWLLVLTNTFHKDLVKSLETVHKISVYMLYLRVLRQQHRQRGA